MRKHVFDVSNLIVKYDEQATLANVEARAGFEKKIKRSYFHIKPVGESDLANWRNYLDYELIHGNLVSFEEYSFY